MMLSPNSLILAVGSGLLAGTLIGCIGVGGVVLVPLLLLRCDINVHLAVTACMAAYVPAGLAGAVAYIRKNAVPRVPAVLLSLVAAPSAFLGAWSLTHLSDFVVKIVMYSVMLATSSLSLVRSLHSHWRQKHRCGSDGLSKEGKGLEEEEEKGLLDADDDKRTVNDASVCRDCAGTNDYVDSDVPGEERDFMNDEGTHTAAGRVQSDDRPGVWSDHTQSPPKEQVEIQTSIQRQARRNSTQEHTRHHSHPVNVWVIIQSVLVGTVTGCGSALTGTSGPVLLLPQLFILLWPPLPALGCAQVIQVPIAVSATIGNVLLSSAHIDFLLAGCIAAGLVPSVFVGAAIADHLPQKALKIGVAIILVCVSAVLLIREVVQH